VTARGCADTAAQCTFVEYRGASENGGGMSVSAAAEVLGRFYENFGTGNIDEAVAVR
jgi:hypothetical protein